MAGLKRKAVTMEAESTSTSPYIPVFEQFRSELDEHHDRRERTIKASRDITAQSKKIIFALQRTRELGKPIHGSITKQTKGMYDTIKERFESIVPDLQGINANRYQYNISGGIQEYMEAILFQHYLETQKLMTHAEAASTLPEGIKLTQSDYLLGIFDMTGELMRFSITYMATNGKLPGGDSLEQSVLADMQALRGYLEGLNAAGNRDLKDFDNKLRVTKQSVEKVENSVYSMLVRGKERPKGWRPDAGPADGRRDVEEIESY
ncbi:uncharacterized protein HMPREF1541_06257 [Cyphellophora europaea CBS 101466]|uniref:Translin-associated protein X n=1 Tax=Cyphellophora europaea (strain CBS 101466) TaxID=1220924 RepID=W2RNW3_CYPE1|nr:uncharacterized protein HMPREF1541_06257 [Cyphellophora europaea CBS 101466]ETN38226.1 hypothetical protein HMPREF1541_06257 [Cyphellophora europaea CBS 101466]